MDDATLAPLLTRLMTGDEEAMRRLFDCAQGPLMRFFFRLCRCADLSEDLLQNTFLRLWHHRGRYGGRGSARSYLYRIAMNEWRNHLGREQRRRAVDEQWRESASTVDDRAPAGDMESAETRREVRRAIAELPPSQREAFLLHRFEGLSCREIADVVGKSPKTVESRLRLALEKLTYKLSVSSRVVDP